MACVCECLVKRVCSSGARDLQHLEEQAVIDSAVFLGAGLS